MRLCLPNSASSCVYIVLLVGGSGTHSLTRLRQESYYYLLRRYLLTTMSPCEARSEFLKLIRKMEELHRLNEDHIKIFMDVDPLHVEPLLIEIFDLNPMRSFAPAPPVNMSDHQHQHQAQQQQQQPPHQPQQQPPPPPPPL